MIPCFRTAITGPAFLEQKNARDFRAFVLHPKPEGLFNFRRIHLVLLIIFPALGHAILIGFGAHILSLALALLLLACLHQLIHLLVISLGRALRRPGIGGKEQKTGGCQRDTNFDNSTHCHELLDLGKLQIESDDTTPAPRR